MSLPYNPMEMGRYLPPDTPRPIQELKIGPFSGGINIHADKAAIADSEMVDCYNFDIDLDGSLLSRPPWSLFSHKQFQSASGAIQTSTTRMLFTGVYHTSTGLNVRFIVYQDLNQQSGPGPGNNSGVYLRFLDGPSAGTDTLLTGPAQIYYSVIRQNNKLFVVPGPDSTLGGFYYDLDAATATNVANMPGGYQSAVYKGSMYVGGGSLTNRSRIAFSAPGDFTNWPTTNFFDVNPGDGGQLIDFLIYQDNILIAKTNSIYVLAYDTNPAQAVIRLVNPKIGVTAINCMVQYEGSVFVQSYDRVYEMVNYDFTRVNTKVPFDINQDRSIPNPYNFNGLAWYTPVWLAVVGDRLLCRFYNFMWVYHLRVRSWTRWISSDVNVQTLGIPMEIDRAGVDLQFMTDNRQYLAPSSLNITVDSLGQFPGGNQEVYQKLMLFTDNFDYDTSTKEGAQLTNTQTVDILLRILTKIYDVGMAHRFKRLMHWGIDVITTRTVTGTLYPLSLAYKVTWATLSTYMWNQLGSWEFPLFAIQQFPVQNSSASDITRRFLRFPKSLRFRLLQFQIDMETVGNRSDGPARFYTITAFIGTKQLVPKAAN